MRTKLKKIDTKYFVLTPLSYQGRFLKIAQKYDPLINFWRRYAV